MRGSRVQRLVAVFFALAVAILPGCGGGTTGTGTGPERLYARVYQGSVTNDTTGAPVPNALVTLLETGEMTSTDVQGQFELRSTVETPTSTLQIESTNINAAVVLSAVDVGTRKVAVDIRISNDGLFAEAKRIDATVEMFWLCDFYFENGEIIRQANPIPPGTVCTLKIGTSEGGHRVGGVPYALQRKACTPGATWVDIALLSTGVGKFRGVGQVSFPFNDGVDSCHYRVIVPYKTPGLPQLRFLIETLTAQDKKNPPTR